MTDTELIMAGSWMLVVALVGWGIYLYKKHRERAESNRQNNTRRSSGTQRNAQRPAQRPVQRTTPAPATETGALIYFATDACSMPDFEYRFNYKKVGAGWRAYIEKMPAYGTRDTALTVTHRYRDSSNNKYYICWDTTITKLSDMQSVSRRWADLTQVYIATGKTIDQQVRERS